MARFYDNTCAGMPDPYARQMMPSGLSDVPDSLEGTTGYTTPAILQASTYALTTDSDATLRRDAIAALNSIATADPRIDFLQRGENTAAASAEDIAAAASVAVLGNYPAGTFGEGLKLASQVIRAGFPTRIFYVSQNGYDLSGIQFIQGVSSVSGWRLY